MVYCEDCEYFKGDGENCVDELTIGMSKIPINCDGFKKKTQKKITNFVGVDKK